MGLVINIRVLCNIDAIVMLMMNRWMNFHKEFPFMTPILHRFFIIILINSIHKIKINSISL